MRLWDTRYYRDWKTPILPENVIVRIFPNLWSLKSHWSQAIGHCIFSWNQVTALFCTIGFGMILGHCFGEITRHGCFWGTLGAFEIVGINVQKFGKVGLSPCQEAQRVTVTYYFWFSSRNKWIPYYYHCPTSQDSLVNSFSLLFSLYTSPWSLKCPFMMIIIT